LLGASLIDPYILVVTVDVVIDLSDDLTAVAGGSHQETRDALDQRIMHATALAVELH
jgi:hypothetical protein